MNFFSTALFGVWHRIKPWVTPGYPTSISGEDLLKAAEAGRAELVKELLARDTEHHFMRPAYRGTALWLAARHGHTRVVEALLSDNADSATATITDDAASGAIIQAAIGGHHEIIDLLAKFYPKQFKGESAAAALLHAAEGAQGLALRALLRAGTPPDARVGLRPTALFAAAAADDSCVFELLEAGANPNAVDASGRTALHHASIHRQNNCIRLLLAGGANLFARDGNGRLAIDEATSEVTRRLLMPVPARPPPQRSGAAPAPAPAVAPSEDPALAE